MIATGRPKGQKVDMHALNSLGGIFVGLGIGLGAGAAAFLLNGWLTRSDRDRASAEPDRLGPFGSYWAFRNRSAFLLLLGAALILSMFGAILQAVT